MLCKERSGPWHCQPEHAGVSLALYLEWSQHRSPALVSVLGLGVALFSSLLTLRPKERSKTDQYGNEEKHRMSLRGPVRQCRLLQ